MLYKKTQGGKFLKSKTTNDLEDIAIIVLHVIRSSPYVFECPIKLNWSVVAINNNLTGVSGKDL